MLKGFFYDVDRYVQEESVLLLNIFKWFLLSAAVGAVVGFVGFVFLRSLELVSGGVAGISYFILLPVAFTANMLIIRYFYPDEDAYTTNKVIQNVHSSKKIRPISGLKAFIIPVLSIASGGSVGKEAPLADIGASIGSTFATVLRLKPGDWRKLSICGISAGFASILGTPIAGAIFGVELLFIGSMLYEMLLPCLIAGITGYTVANALGANYIFHPILFSPEFSAEMLFKIVLAGVMFGVCSLLVIEIIKYAREFTRLFKKYSWAKSIVGGLILAGLAAFFSSEYLGLGENMINSALTSSGGIAPYGFLLKIVFTALTLASGGVGGIVSPVMVIGSSAGHTFGLWLGLDPAMVAAIGLVAVLAGTTNTPIAASILAIELFGPGIAPYAAIASITSFLMTGHRSIYPAQVLKINKSPDIEMELGKTIGESGFTYREEKSIMRHVEKVGKYVPFKIRYVKERSGPNKGYVDLTKDPSQGEGVPEASADLPEDPDIKSPVGTDEAVNNEAISK
ncbi:chloride channel protein [Candidatus Woesearchaeota archaeon]|nr:chloride channel protein [Candidatus Woesearchaeota archaeon]